MATISNGESGSSVRTKLNEIINKVEGVTSIDNDITFGDNDKAIFGGVTSELQIYSDGSDSIISDTGTGNLIVKTNGNNIQFEDNAGNDIFKVTPTNTNIYHGTSGVKLTTTSTGVDITGTLTSDGLTVDGTATIGNNQSLEILDGGGDISLRLNNLSSGANSGRIEFDPDNTAAGSELVILGDGSYVAKFAGGGDISFYDSAGSSQSFYWDAAAESLGIGTTSPSSKLHIVGSTSAERALIIEDTFGNDVQIQASVSGGNASMVFKTEDTERMRIDSSGNLAVGTTPYDSSPDGGFTFTVGGGSSYLNIGHTSGTSSGHAYVRFFYAGGNIGQISQNGTTAVQYLTTSDYRLKENVVELTGATDRLKQIPVHRFNFINDPDDTVDGFLAHEVQAVVPEAIHGTKDEVDDDGNPVYQGIDQSKLVPLLVATIKELEARITALENA